MKLLDLFCGGGGASMGYYRAGYDVVGVDLNPQPDYPFKFHQADALKFPLHAFDAIHASPPCQAYTTMNNRHRGAGGKADSHDELIIRVRTRLQDSGVPWIIENVVGARRDMPDAILLHGGMFGLGVNRPRLFQSNMLLMVPAAPLVFDGLGVYGSMDGRRLATRTDGSIQRAAKTLTEAQAAMGIDWLPWKALKEAIPPAYTEYLAQFLMTSENVA